MKKQEKAIELLKDALYTDGGHHKQYYIEQALITLTSEEYVKKEKEECEWEEGIPD